MKILIVGNKFFGYTERVCEHLGTYNQVDTIYIYQPCFRDRILKKLFKIGFPTKKYYKNQLQNLSVEYDRILVFGGGAPTELLVDIKNRYQQCKLYLYLSADMESYRFTDTYINLFDKVMTYSLNDAKAYNFIYQPWFFTHKKITAKSIGISFIGTIHDSRLKTLINVTKIKNTSIFYYIYTDKLAFCKQAFKWMVLRNYIHFRGLPYENYIEVLSQSKATLDLPEKRQTNITTRPIEALGTQTKIITSNRYIVNYDFYKKENIFILTPESTNQQILEWLDIPYTQLDESIVSHYSIENWCNDVLC